MLTTLGCLWSIYFGVGLLCQGLSLFFGIPPFLIQPYLQLPKISSYFDAMPSFILNYHAYADIEDAHKVSRSPEGDIKPRSHPGLMYRPCRGFYTGSTLKWHNLFPARHPVSMGRCPMPHLIMSFHSKLGIRGRHCRNIIPRFWGECPFAPCCPVLYPNSTWIPPELGSGGVQVGFEWSTSGQWGRCLAHPGNCQRGMPIRYYTWQILCLQDN